MQKGLYAKTSRVTDYSATVDDMQASICQTASHTQQRIDSLEATVSSQTTRISTLTRSSEALATENTNLWERLARLEATVNDYQTQLTTLSAVPADVSALKDKLKTFSDPHGQGSVSVSADPTIADTLKQHATQLKNRFSQLEAISGMKSSVEIATEEHIEHDDRIDAIEAEVKKMSTSQKKVKKQVGDIDQSLEVLASVPTQIEAANASLMKIGSHMEDIKQLKQVLTNIAELQSDIENHTKWLKEDSDDSKSLLDRIASCEDTLNISMPQDNDARGHAGNRRDYVSHDGGKRDEDRHDRDDDDEGDKKHDDIYGGDARRQSRQFRQASLSQRHAST